MTLPLLLALAIAVVLFYWVWVVARAESRRNARHSSRRKVERWGRHSFRSIRAVCWDLGRERASSSTQAPERRAFVVKGKTAHTVDFDYFRMWHLKWIEQFQGPLSPYLHVHFLFETSDFDRPTIRVNVSSKIEGDEWCAKLAILLQ